jgi:hypothetical protein
MELDWLANTLPFTSWFLLLLNGLLLLLVDCLGNWTDLTGRERSAAAFLFTEGKTKLSLGF